LRFLAERGLPVNSADAIVRELYEPGMAGWQTLRAHFGERFVKGPKQPVDNAALTEALREEPALRRDLEKLIHPLVSERLERFFDNAEQASHDFACAEVPLFLEAGWKDADPPGGLTLAGVHCPLEIRRARLHERGWSDEHIDMVESWQWPEAEKMRASDMLLDNSGTPDSLRLAVFDLLETLEKQRREKHAELVKRLETLWSV
jgi:23S rRNA pseudouridine1911/1915/1917 synthase